MRLTSRIQNKVLGLALLVVFLVTSPVLFAEQVGVFQEAPCPMPVPEGVTEGEDLTCGYVVVPERHSKQDGRTLKLLIAKIASVGENPEKDALVPLPTGPGSSAIDAFLDFMASPVGGMFRAKQDVVIFEQRGLYHSEKNLVCDEVHRWFQERRFEDIQGQESVDKTVEAYKACRDSLLKKDVNLEAYKYTEIADDVVMIMDALGYKKFNALGVSAGTMLGQRLLKAHSNRLRSVLLNSVGRIDWDMHADWSTLSPRFLKKLFDACVADDECNGAYPDLGVKLERIVERLNREPFTVEVEHPETGGKATAYINGDVFAEAIFVSGYSTGALAGLPKMIHSVDAGDNSFLEQLASRPGGPGERFAWGLGYAVFCSEYPAFSDEEITFAGLYPYYEESVANVIWGARVTKGICESWGLKRLDPEDFELAESDVPTLVMSGEFDSITPPESGEAVAATLSNSYEVVVPGAAHSSIESGPCSFSIALQFLEDPTREPDDSCLAEMGIKFTIEP